MSAVQIVGSTTESGVLLFLAPSRPWEVECLAGRDKRMTVLRIVDPNLALLVILEQLVFWVLYST